MSNNLGGERVNEGQVSKEMTINDGLGTLDAAATEVVAIDLSAGSVTTTADVLNSAAVFTLNPSSAQTLTLPAVKRRVLFINLGTAIATLALGTASIPIAAGAAVPVALIGTANGLYAESSGSAPASSGSGSGSSSGGGSSGGASTASGPFTTYRLGLPASPAAALGIATVAFTDASGNALAVQSVAATSEYGSQYGPSNLIDGDANTFWASSGSLPDYLDFTFAQPVTIGSIAITSRPDNNAAQAPTIVDLYGTNEPLSGGPVAFAYLATIGFPAWAGSTQTQTASVDLG